MQCAPTTYVIMILQSLSFFGTANAFIRNAGSLDSPEEAEFEARSVTLGPRSWMVGSLKVQLFPRCQVNITEEGVIREAEACEDS